MVVRAFVNNNTWTYKNFFSDDDMYGSIRDSFYVVLTITLVYIIFFFIGLIANVITCAVVTNQKILLTVNNLYLVNLAVSQLLLVIFVLPQEIYSIWTPYPCFGYTFCFLQKFCAETSSIAMVYTIAGFTSEKYIFFFNPTLSYNLSKLSRVLTYIPIIWIVSILFAMPQVVQFGAIHVDNNSTYHIIYNVNKFGYFFEISTFLAFILPLTIITVLLGMITFKLRTLTLLKKISTRKHQQEPLSQDIVKTLVFVVSFIICWSPFHIQRLITKYADLSNISTLFEIWNVINRILYFVPTMNPLLYIIMSKKWRLYLKYMIMRLCCRQPVRDSKNIFNLRFTQRVPGIRDSYKDEPNNLQTNLSSSHEDSAIAMLPESSCCETKGLDNPFTATQSLIVESRCEICMAKNPKYMLNRITPNMKLVPVHISKPSPTKMHKLLQIISCTDISSDSYHSSPTKTKYLRDRSPRNSSML